MLSKECSTGKQLELKLATDGLLPCGFEQDAYETAKKIISFRGTEALLYIGLRRYDDFQDDTDRAYWDEVRRACKYILGFYFLPKKPPLKD